MTLPIFMLGLHLGAAVVMACFAFSFHNSAQWWRNQRDETRTLVVTAGNEYLRAAATDLLQDCERGIRRTSRMVWFNIAFTLFNLGCVYHYYAAF